MAVLPVRYIDLMTICKQHNLSPETINLMWYIRRRKKEKADAEQARTD